MIIPLPLVGLALARTIPLQKKTVLPLKPRKVNNVKRYTRPVIKRSTKPFSFSLPASINNLVRGLSSAVTRVSAKRPANNYDEVVKGFLPSGAVLLAPLYPVNAGKYLLTDLDGDAQKELVATYRLDSTNTTIVLKKQNDKWSRITDTATSKYSEMNFLSSANIEGNNREQLLIGWKAQEGHGELVGYSLQDGKLSEMFTHKYNNMELLNPINAKEPGGQPQLAFWNRKGNDAYNIEVKYWNGTDLAPVTNHAQYYSSRVLPYYGRRVKKMPYEPANWYHLADALEKSGMYEDGLTAVEMGMRLNPSSPTIEEFGRLKERLSKNI